MSARLNTPQVTIACDIDGVLAPVTLDAGKECIWLPKVNYGTHVLTRVVSALKYWHHLGARVMWHSTWRPPYTDELAEMLNLPSFEVFASDEEFLRPTPPERWWKLAAVERWLRESTSEDRLIWIDDDIDYGISTGEITPSILEDPRLTILSPDTEIGLSQEQIDQIVGIVAREV